MSSQQLIQYRKQINELSQCKKYPATKSNQQSKEEFDQKSKIEKINKQIECNTCRQINSNIRQYQTFVDKFNSFAPFKSQDNTNQNCNQKLDEFLDFSKEQILIYLVDLSQQQIKKDQNITNSQNHIIEYSKDEDNLCQQIKDKKQFSKQFKRDIQHLVQTAPSELKITQHLHLKTKPNHNQICSITVVSNQQESNNQQPEVNNIISEKQNLISLLRQQFNNNPEGIELELNELGNTQLMKKLQNIKKALLNNKQINNQYLVCQQNLKNQIKNLKNKINHISTNIPIDSNCYQQSTYKQPNKSLPPPDISKMFEQLAKYKEFITCVKLQQIQGINNLNQQYLYLQKNNQELQKYKIDLINKSIQSHEQLIEAKCDEQIQYQLNKQSLQKQIAIQRKKYDIFKNYHRKSRSNLERICDQRQTRKIKIIKEETKQDEFLKGLLVGVGFILALVVVVIYYHIR